MVRGKATGRVSVRVTAKVKVRVKVRATVIVRVKGNEIAAQVKLADLKINYATISDIPDPETVKSLGKRYEKAISILEEEDFATAVLSEMVRF